MRTMVIRRGAQRATYTLPQELVDRIKIGANTRDIQPSKYLAMLLDRVAWDKPLDRREKAIAGGVRPDDPEFVALLLLGRWAVHRPGKVKDQVARDAEEEHTSALKVALSKTSVSNHQTWVDWRRNGGAAPYQNAMKGPSAKPHLTREQQVQYRRIAMQLLHEAWGFYWGAWASLHCPLVRVESGTRETEIDKVWKEYAGVARRSSMMEPVPSINKRADEDRRAGYAKSLPAA